jgi:hypothetical protein
MVRESARSWLVLSASVAGLVFMSGGCGKRPEPIPAGSFRAVVEDVVDNDLVLVKRITITAPGMKVVSISEKGGEDRITADADPKTGLATAQVVFVADLIKNQSTSDNILRWMVRMKGGGATVGGPGLSSAGSAGSLRDVLALNLGSGIHPLLQDIKLGHVQGRELILKVE